MRVGAGEEAGQEAVESVGGEGLDFLEIDGAAELRVQGGDGAVGRGDAAGDDALEVGEVGVHVEGEAVVGDPAAHGHADGGDFAVGDPDAGLAVAAGGDEAEFADGVDQDLFQKAQVGVEVFAGGEVDDGVADELAGAVVGDVAAAVGLDDFDAFVGEAGGVPDEVLVRAAAQADGIDGVV